jgi:magnesium transporter
MSRSFNSRHEQKRHRRRRRRPTMPGTAPGTISSDPNACTTTMRLIGFDQQNLIEREIQQPSELAELMRCYSTIWVDVTGLRNIDVIRNLGEFLGLHPLALEDVVNVHQRAKLDAFEKYLFIVARMIDSEDTGNSEQISFFLFPGIIVSFQERPGDCWEPVRQRLRQRRGRYPTLGSDYLLYALLDSIIDSYFPVIDRLSDQVDEIEDEITKNPQPELIRRVHDLRGQLLHVRRAIRPHREMINELSHDTSPLISAETHVFIRDCYDHVVQVIDTVDTYRELTSDLRDYYLSTVNNSMNEVMKLLTIISTIFIPLSFVAGVYGMNFDTQHPWNMPELSWPYGYPFALGLMLIISFFLLWLFRRRQWI